MCVWCACNIQGGINCHIKCNLVLFKSFCNDTFIDVSKFNQVKAWKYRATIFRIFSIKNSQPRGSYEGKGFKTNAMIFVLILIISKIAIINSIHSNEGKIASGNVTLSRDLSDLKSIATSLI